MVVWKTTDHGFKSGFDIFSCVALSHFASMSLSKAEIIKLRLQLCMRIK